MLKHITYTKSGGDVSSRVVYYLQLVDDKVLSIDMTPFSDSERLEATKVLDDIRAEYIAKIKESGYGDRYRYFFLNQIT